MIFSIDILLVLGYTSHRNIAQEFRVWHFAILTGYSLCDVFICSYL